MNDDLAPDQRDALDVVRSTRGACPSGEVLVDYEMLSPQDRRSHPAHPHIVSCSRCQLVLLHVTGDSTSSTHGAHSTGVSSVARWALPLAAVAVFGVALTMINRDTPVEPARVDQIDTVRGTDLQVVSPAGATDQLREFTWQSPIRADRYRVIVRRGATTVWQAETTQLRVAPPPTGTIERDVQYEWQVEALDREGNVRLTSPPQSFVVY